MSHRACLTAVLGLTALAGMPSPARADDEANASAPHPSAVSSPALGRTPPPQDQLPMRIADLQHDSPLPPGYLQRERPRDELLIGGLATTGSLHLASVATGVMGLSGARLFEGADGGDYAALLAPAAGPFVGAATLRGNAPTRVGIVIVGLGQLTGLCLIVAGLTSTESYGVRVVGVEILVDAALSPDTAGLGLSGRF